MVVGRRWVGIGVEIGVGIDEVVTRACPTQLPPTHPPTLPYASPNYHYIGPKIAPEPTYLAVREAHRTVSPFSQVPVITLQKPRLAL